MREGRKREREKEKTERKKGEAAGEYFLNQ